MIEIPYSNQAKLMIEKMKNFDTEELEKFYMKNNFCITGGVVLQYLELKANKRIDKDGNILDKNGNIIN